MLQLTDDGLKPPPVAPRLPSPAPSIKSAEHNCENGGIADDGRIQALYHEASLGRISAIQFGKEVRLDPNLEDAFLLRHRLSAGVVQFLGKARSRTSSIWCLSNNVSEWSRKLRERFDLQHLLNGLVISGDVGARKPDPVIYKHLLAQTGAEAKNIILFDDRPRNLDAAAALGLQTILFGPARQVHPPQHRTVADFNQLFDYVCQTNEV
jgi:HAD superfamily hydrolase (TIGR01509 family)